MKIPAIDVAPLFAGPSAARDRTDAAIAEAAADSGFMSIRNMPDAIAPTRQMRARLLRLFSLDEANKRALWRKSFDPAGPALYRGYFPLQSGVATYKEGIDMGPDVAHSGWRADPSDPLTEATPLPPEAALPGWRDDIRAYYQGMEALGAAMMRSLARSLSLDEYLFAPAFRDGISTLRLIRYPERPESSFVGADPAKVFVEHDGERRYVIGAAHVDSGFVTLLAQDGVPGLQAKSREGAWIDVPPAEGTMAVNFGGLLERWTGGRIKATEHRVLGPGRERFSIPFFYEPRVDAVIRPLPGGPDFPPFTYGDHLWAAMVKFVEFRAIAGLRKPRGVPA